jgi:purine-binding chemotaxis protein CheW
VSGEDWLALRTAALARPRDSGDVASDGPETERARLSVLRVTAAGARYALDLRWLRGVRTLHRLARLPQAPPHVAGLVGHEGAVVPVFYLAAVLGAPLAALPERGQALVLGRDGDLVAVAVDEVGETRAVSAAEILEVPANVSERLRSVLLGATVDGLLLLDTAALLAGAAMFVDIPHRSSAARGRGNRDPA